MKSWKKILGLAGVSALALSLAACGSSSSKSSAKDDNGVTTLLMYQVGDKPENYDQLMSAANKIFEKELKVKIDLQYIGWGDWDQKMSTIIASGESYDISFASNYVANAQKGAYADLTELAPKYAKDYYDQLPESYIKGNTIDGKLYAIPVYGNVYAQQVLTFNKQYLDKYNIDISKINTYEDATEALKTFHENEPNVAAFAIGSSYNTSGDYDYPLGKQYPFAVKTSDSGAPKIINQYEDADFMSTLDTLHSWYQAGYIPTDAATSTTSYDLDKNTWFMREETQGPLDYGDTILTQAAGQELVSRAVTPKLKSTAQAQMANFVVSNTSKHKELAVKALNLLNTDAELLNGLVYGAEGTAYEKTGDTTIKLLDGYKANNHMSAWNTGNNLILYTPDTVSADQVAQRDKNIEEATESPILGFNFKTDAVKTEVSNIANVMSRYSASLSTGTVDPEDTVPKLLADLKTAGWDKVQKEMQSQLDDYIDSAK